MIDYATLDGILAKKDASIREVMVECPEVAQLTLNSIPLYYSVVRLMGYTEIGIVVLDEAGERIVEYASHNDRTTGKITEVVGGDVVSGQTSFKNPDIIARVRESVLLDILRKRDWVRKHKIRGFLRYRHEFELNKDIKTLLLQRMLGV